MDFLPLSSDGLIYTSPIVGNKKEHKAKEYAKGQKKRKITLASNVTAAEEQKYAIFDGILTELTDNRLTFGDLMLHVFNPIYKQGETRWQGFFRNHALATSILGFWVAPENGETVHEEVREWAGGRQLAMLPLQNTFKPAVEHIPKLHAYPQTHTGIIMKIFDVFATSTQNLHKDLPSRIVKRATIVTSAALALLGEFSHKNKFSQIFTATLCQLSGAMCDMAQGVAATGLYAASYVNINMVFRAVEQVVWRTDSQENGTCSTTWLLWKATLEEMSINDLNSADKPVIGPYTAAPLSIDDILLSTPELQLMDKCLCHCILRIIVEHGGERFECFCDELNKSLPVTPEQIDLHKTPLCPLPAWNINESTIIGNTEDSHIGTGFSRLRCLHSLLNICAGNEVWIPGLFHAKIADMHCVVCDMHRFFVTHWGTPNGTPNPGSLSFHNTYLHHVPILLSSLPPFCTCRDLVFILLYSRVLHCQLLETGTLTLDECAETINTFRNLKKLVGIIHEKYANSECISDLRWKHKMAGDSSSETLGDEIFGNACLLLRDALISWELTDAVKAGDSGWIVLVLKLLACSYRGNSRTKYAHEMLHIIHNLTQVWPAFIRKIVLNNWLLNPTRNPFSWVKVDLMQEHMNYWIKIIYQAHGSSASWEWLEMVSPRISVLRRLSKMITKNNISLLMASLHEHNVYKIKGHVFAKDDGSATSDVILVGVQQLIDSSSNPLTEYNTMFKRLQSCHRLQPLMGSWSDDELVVHSPPGQNLQSAVGNTVDAINTPDSDHNGNFSGSEDDNDHWNVDDQAVQQLSDFKRTLDGDDSEATLTRNTAADVALDMDGGEDGFLFAISDPDDYFLDDGAIDNSDDDYVDE
ncbi:hypothetical protein B0H14DRAFT_3095841 [Mycena olivaceomarginata]|nr:hypothetical protein B0H14DRAFT_3095841 [Mycena olivaceomarginata]